MPQVDAWSIIRASLHRQHWERIFSWSRVAAAISALEPPMEINSNTIQDHTPTLSRWGPMRQINCSRDKKLSKEILRTTRLHLSTSENSIGRANTWLWLDSTTNQRSFFPRRPWVSIKTCCGSNTCMPMKTWGTWTRPWATNQVTFQARGKATAQVIRRSGPTCWLPTSGNTSSWEHFCCWRHTHYNSSSAMVWTKWTSSR